MYCFVLNGREHAWKLALSLAKHPKNDISWILRRLSPELGVDLKVAWAQPYQPQLPLRQREPHRRCIAVRQQEAPKASRRRKVNQCGAPGPDMPLRKAGTPPARNPRLRGLLANRGRKNQDYGMFPIRVKGSNPSPGSARRPSGTAQTGTVSPPGTD